MLNGQLRILTFFRCSAGTVTRLGGIQAALCHDKEPRDNTATTMADFCVRDPTILVRLSFR